MAKTLDAAGVKRLIQEIKGANKNLNAPIPISTENTPESMAQNVKNIADYVEKAKAAGIDTTKSFRLTLEIEGYPVEGSYDTRYIYGLQITDDAFAFLYDIDVRTGEVFTPFEFVTARSMQKVTSSMLDKGARNPIIITGDMTEVDEETYQKLLQEGTDVILNLGGGTFVELQGIFNTGDTLNLIFGYSQFDESNDGAIATYTISINTSAPHTLTLAAIGACEPVSKSTLSSVLQEIDLTGTDADRKAKLDQFETDWKALTGASDLTGARFVGKFGITEDVERNVTGIMTYCAGDASNDITDNCFYGICNGYSFSKQKSQIAVKVSCTDGSLTITPLFSHLEAITIKTNNSIASKAANVAAIKAYVDNLTALGVDTTKGFLIPINVEGQGSGFISRLGGTDSYMGIMTSYGIPTFGIAVSVAGEYYSYRFQTDSDNSLTTNSKQIVGAINEINANAVHSDKLVPTLEAITIKTGNTPEDKAANVAAIKAYVDNLTALGVDVTKGYMIPCKFPNSSAGVLSAVSNSLIVAITTNGRGELNCYEVYIGGDNPGAVYSIGGFQLKISSNLTTTSKQIVGAINEVNALAKGYSTPIELTTETAQNKTAIDARVAAFTAQGISLTNGCCIPVTYKGVYAGNISLINGDWYGLLVKNTNNPADNINIKLSADGTITEGNSAQ